MKIIYRYIVCILLFTCLGFTQDTLITKQGKQYIGKVIDRDSKSVKFSYSGWDTPKRFYLNSAEVFLGPKISKKEEKYISFSIKEKAIYDAKRKARKWVMYPTLAGVISLSCISIFDADFGNPTEGSIGGALSVALPYFTLDTWDKNSETQLILHNYNDSEKEIYHSVYKKTFKRKKLLYSAIGIPVAGGVGFILFMATFSYSGPDLPDF
ncbi:hypothetical protein N9N24_03720 [Candidatus Marinimicrobia bacterium]|nr:hypothetical protein [Candidatus Neomarinimicrobiota bacterium]